MGSLFTTPSNESEVSGSRKRSHPDSDNDDERDSDGRNIDLDTPKRKKLKSTSKYIYQTLFLNGENSDITIIALGKTWRLHKIYLCQSGYFSSMFSGSWKESTQSVITMDIPDDKIDIDALHIAFGSLYRDDVLIKPAKVIRILAAATLLQLDGLIQQCADTMKETISSRSVCGYYLASETYGLQYITKKCKHWLEKNLMTFQTVNLLREIQPELMKELVASPDLFVMQVEMDIYTMLKKWSFLQFVPNWTGSSKQLGEAAEDFFKQPENKNRLKFEKKGAVEAFRGIRFRHVLNDLTSAGLLEEENLIPREWLLSLYKSQWQYMLSMEQGIDKGPPDTVSNEKFYQHALRCGRVLQKEGEYCWRWTGFNFGVDLLVTFANRLLIFKRNTFSQTPSNSVSLQTKRHIMFRITVASFDNLGQTSYLKSSGVHRLSLAKDEEAVIMSVDRNVVFPLHISVNLLYYSPKDDPVFDNVKPAVTSQVDTSRLSQSGRQQNDTEQPSTSSDRLSQSGRHQNDTEQPSTSSGRSDRQFLSLLPSQVSQSQESSTTTSSSQLSSTSQSSSTSTSSSLEMQRPRYQTGSPARRRISFTNRPAGDGQDSSDLVDHQNPQQVPPPNPQQLPPIPEQDGGMDQL